MAHTQDKSSALGQGVVIFVYLAVLTIIEYFVAISFNATSLLVVVAVIKAALVMYYYMHIYKLNQDDGGDEHSYTYKTGSNRLGLWLFLLSDGFVFAGLLVMRSNLLGLTRPHLNQLLGLGVTAVLLISSFFMAKAALENSGTIASLVKKSRSPLFCFALGSSESSLASLSKGSPFFTRSAIAFAAFSFSTTTSGFASWATAMRMWLARTCSGALN